MQNKGTLPLNIRDEQTAGEVTVRDIDDWIFQFERVAATRLKQIFEQDLDETPKKLIEQLMRLRSC